MAFDNIVALMALFVTRRVFVLRLSTLSSPVATDGLAGNNGAKATCKNEMIYT